MALELSELTAISPIDGRYRSKLASLASLFSEYGLIKYRVRVEARYLAFLLPALAEKLGDKVPALTKDDIELLNSIHESFDLKEAEKVKAHEKVTNHDVKAVELYLRDRLRPELTEYIHFGLTSQDINNVAIPWLLKDFMNQYHDEITKNVMEPLEAMSEASFGLAMLARTHGQPATPTTLGKELYVWVYRLNKQLRQLKESVTHSAKFGGATGQFNAHSVAFPQIDWVSFGNQFVSSLGLARELWTTQISNYDNMAALFDNLARINVILLDASKDIWQYISMEYFGQKIISTEVGSSAMPHKVNPIDFENAEGNLGMANAIFNYLSSKLPISRLQRDLTDSTVLRNIGTPIAHTILAFQSFKRGMSKLTIRKEVIETDLMDNSVVIAEAIQTILRRENYPNPYDAVKKLTRTGAKLDAELLHSFVDSLQGINEAVKAELKDVSPQTYLGQFPKKGNF